MALDIGLNNPGSMDAVAHALKIIDTIGTIHEEISQTECSATSEIYRLARSLPEGPVSFDRTVIVAAETARGALDQVSGILRNNLATSVIVLQSLLRVALVGGCRTVFAILPADPAVRADNARVLVAQESLGFTKALDQYFGFREFAGLRPEPNYVERAHQQAKAILGGRRPPGDGIVVARAAEQIGLSLAEFAEHPERFATQQQEHIKWVWNTYSGLSHTHAWPRLLPAAGQEAATPGDFAGDLLLVAGAGHVAMEAFRDRLRPGTAGTTSAVAFS